MNAPKDLISGARKRGELIESVAASNPILEMDWAEECALELVAGRELAGMKLGLTSVAKQITMGIAQPIFGYLPADDLIPTDQEIPLSKYRQPRIEPEVVFRLTKSLDREISLPEVADYAGEVAIGLEIIDSSFKDYKFTAVDVVADNASAAGYVIGQWQPVTNLVGTAQVDFSRDGELLSQVNPNSILDNPLQAIVELSKFLGRKQMTLSAGSIIFAGAMCDADPLRAGATYSVSVEGLGQLQARVAC